MGISVFHQSKACSTGGPGRLLSQAWGLQQEALLPEMLLTELQACKLITPIPVAWYLGDTKHLPEVTRVPSWGDHWEELGALQKWR